MPPHHHHSLSAASLFPRSSLLCPPADLFVFYFRVLCHTAAHCAHLSPWHANHRDAFVTTPWPTAEGWLSWGRGREEMIQDKRGKGWGEEIKKRYIVPRFVNHDGVRIACAFSNDLSLAGLPAAERAKLSFWPRRRRMPGYCSQWSFRASLFSSDGSANDGIS